MKKRQRKKNFKKWLKGQTFGSTLQIPIPAGVFEFKDELDHQIKIAAAYSHIDFKDPQPIISTVTA